MDIQNKISLNRTCIVCGKELIVSNRFSKKYRDNRIYCSNNCKSIDNKFTHKKVEGIECKRCSKCKKYYSLTQFSKGKEWDGLTNIRKWCSKEYKKKRKEELKILEKVREYPELTAIRKIFSTYRSSARARGLSFTITIGQLEELIKSNCFYCGSSGQEKIFQDETRIGQYSYNGIDRLDNSKGYIQDNCVACCVICNKMKHILTVDEFEKHIKKIYENLNSNDTNGI